MQSSILKKALCKLCVLATALALGSSGIEAENLDLGEMGAALALPVITGGFAGNPIKATGGEMVLGSIFDEAIQKLTTQVAVTLATVTNGRNTPVLLKVDIISGDTIDSDLDGIADGTEGDNWQSTSFECLLTGRETTTFVIYPPNGERPNKPTGRSELYVECSDGDDPEGTPRALFTDVQNGILFVAAADPDSGAIVSEDILFGDAVVADFSLGQAYSVEAISFQAGSGLNDGNKVYQFDGSEYSSFPQVLATNFLAPFDVSVMNVVTKTETVFPSIETELILFTLDGTTGNIPGPRVKLGGLAYNDDEQPFDFSYEFDCFDIVALEDIDANFTFNPGPEFEFENSLVVLSAVNPGLGFGSISGHLQLTSQPIGTGIDVHDAQYGDGNSIRRRAVHGWIVQGITGFGLIPPDEPIPGFPGVALSGKSSAISGKSSFARPLGQSTTGLIPFLGDDAAVLDADTRN